MPHFILPGQQHARPDHNDDNRERLNTNRLYSVTLFWLVMIFRSACTYLGGPKQNKMTNHGGNQTLTAVEVSPNIEAVAKNDLHGSQTSQAFASIRVGNEGAFKGDESDGKVDWTVRKMCALGALSMLYTGQQIPLYFVVAVLSIVATDLGAPLNIAWLPTVNALTIAAVTPFVGHLQDLVGKRYTVLVGSASICLACILLATAQSLTQALVAFTFNGAGAACAELTGIAGFAEIVSVKRRGYYLSALNVSFLPFTPYVLYARLLSTGGPSPSWRWGLWISLIYNLIAGVGLALCYFPRDNLRAHGANTATVLKRIDYIGGILSISGVILVLIALHVGGVDHPWTSAYVLCTLTIGIALLFCWIVWETRFPKAPMVPKELFIEGRTVGFALAVSFVAGMNYLSLLSFWPLALSSVWDSSPVQVGLRAFPVTLFVSIGGIFWTVLLSVWKSGHPFILCLACAIVTAFCGALASMTPDNANMSMTFATIASFGIGGLIVPTSAIALFACPDALLATCAGVSLSCRAIGAAIGFSIYYNIFIQKLNTYLPNLISEYAIDAGLPATSAESFTRLYIISPGDAAQLAGVTPQILDRAAYGAEWAYAKSFHYVWYASIGFGVCAMICSLCIPNTKRFQTNRIAVEL